MFEIIFEKLNFRRQLRAQGASCSKSCVHTYVNVSCALHSVSILSFPVSYVFPVYTGHGNSVERLENEYSNNVVPCLFFRLHFVGQSASINSASRDKIIRPGRSQVTLIFCQYIIYVVGIAIVK